jgi:hydroxypyruvate reductase
VTGRQAALDIWQAALAAADVEPLIRRALHVRGGRVAVGDHGWNLDTLDRVIVLGCGKASAAMARAVEGILGDRIADGFVVVKDGYTSPTYRVRLAEAGHPVPDARGQNAAARLLALAGAAGPKDLVLMLISGGGSALTPAPAPGITLEQKQVVTGLLLAAGATIDELNAVRKHLSLLKGGQLARAAQPASLLTLVLSDVIGDPLDVIASGPTAPDPTTFGDALDVLGRRGLLARVPPSVRSRLEAGKRGELDETPKPGDPLFTHVTNHIVGNNALVVDAAAAHARALGYEPHILTRSLHGEAREVAREFVEKARRLRPPACLIAGGETTVSVGGRGRGGRCQEFALAAALAVRPDEDLVVLAAGTDGTDGPTDAAGGMIDAETLARGRAAGFDARRALGDNDSHTYLRACDGAVVTGPTNTNLLDVYLAVRPAPMR